MKFWCFFLFIHLKGMFVYVEKDKKWIFFGVMRMGNVMNEMGVMKPRKTFINTLDYITKWCLCKVEMKYFSCGHKNPWLKRFEKKEKFLNSRYSLE